MCGHPTICVCVHLGTESETKEFMQVCVKTVKKYPDDDYRSPVFIFERLCSIIFPVRESLTLPQSLKNIVLRFKMGKLYSEMLMLLHRRRMM
jgi:hypothetical protein